MLSEFYQLLTAVKLDEEKKEKLRDKISNWAENVFIPKLRRKSNRTEKCRLVASVERHTFQNDLFALSWKHFKFENDSEKSKGAIVEGQRKKIGDRMKATYFQKRIVRRNSHLRNISISKNDIEDETEGWQPNDQLQEIYTGGEAAIFNIKYENCEMAVRVHVFDPYLFLENSGTCQYKTKTHLFSGKFDFVIFLDWLIVKIMTKRS